MAALSSRRSMQVLAQLAQLAQLASWATAQENLPVRKREDPGCIDHTPWGHLVAFPVLAITPTSKPLRCWCLQAGAQAEPSNELRGEEKTDEVMAKTDGASIACCIIGIMTVLIAVTVGLVHNLGMVALTCMGMVFKRAPSCCCH
jgi:hypothetical protein